MAGRKQDPIWIHFDRFEIPGLSGWKAKCTLCQKEMQGVVNRLKQHYAVCSSNSQDLSIETMELSQENPPNDLFGEAQTFGNMSRQVISKKRKICNTISDYMVKTTKLEAELLDEQIARYFYATNTPFVAVEHPEFVKLINMLRPGYSPPSRYNVGGNLLVKVQSSLMDTCRLTLENKTVSLSLDGWSNVHNEPVVCVSVTTDKGDSFLTDTIDTSGYAHTSDYLTLLAENSIKTCEDKFKCRVGSVVTDNAANMAKMRRHLEENISRDILTYGCSAHLLNLLAQDVEIPEVKEQVVRIVKYFRNTHLPAARYKASGGKALVLPHEVRWNTITDSLESYITNWPILVKVCEEYRDEINLDIANKVKNYSIKRSAEEFLVRLKPISIALDRIQRDNAIISDTVEIWKMLQTDFMNTRQPKNVLTKAQNRATQAITPAHYCANLIDPRYRGNLMSTAEITIAMEHMSDRYPETLGTLVKFRADCEPFKPYMFNNNIIENVTPSCWWRSLDGIVEKYFADVAEKLLTAVASSAGVERIFSTFGYIHSNIRNRLGIEKAAKLVFIYRILNQSK